MQDDYEEDWVAEASRSAESTSLVEFSAYKKALRLRSGFCSETGCPHLFYNRGLEKCRSHLKWYQIASHRLKSLLSRAFFWA